MPKRVRHPAGCPFASGCFPPRLTATQLPSATYDVTSHGKDSHLCRQSVLADALTPAEAGVQSREPGAGPCLDSRFRGGDENGSSRHSRGSGNPVNGSRHTSHASRDSDARSAPVSSACSIA
jgi:hypothetical protein